MAKVELTYNPYTVNTEIIINGVPFDETTSPLTYVKNKRLQEWIEPRRGWKGIYSVLRDCTGDSWLDLEFTGTFGDFNDLVYAKDKFGDCFDNINLIHENKKTAGDIDPYQRMIKLKELYQELQNGPVEEFKTTDIQENFEAAINSDFRIVVVAPMSSGKSTLINAIIGEDLLPAVNQATTAVLTEIRDDDQLDYFSVSAIDKEGNLVVNNVRATKELISDLNYKKDPTDKDGKESFIKLIKLDGNIRHLPSNALNTVFVDTPGGNNAQNSEHEEMMDEAINDENKSLILYVFNGTQLATNDSDNILKKIAKAMKNSVNGKQSRDRFLFVANRMDDIDPSKEPYDKVINDTILPQLAEKGIIEPNLFLVSAETAKLIRMEYAGEELSEDEEDNLAAFVKKFNRPSRMLTKYSALSSGDKEKIMSEAEECMNVARTSDSAKEVQVNQYRAAEINSGITAVEEAIKQYLEKYAVAIKIKTVHDTFMDKVEERRMIDNCQDEWSASVENFEKAQKELKKKENSYKSGVKSQQLLEKVAQIKLDINPIRRLQTKVLRSLDTLSDGKPEKVTKDEAERILKQMQKDLEKMGNEAQKDLDEALNVGVRRSCEDIISEYEKYINKLDEEGTLSIGGFNMKKTVDFKPFNISKADDLLNDKKFITIQREKAGKHKVEKSGILASILRIFGWGGYTYVDDYEDREYVNLKALISDQVQKIKKSFDKTIDSAVQQTVEEVDDLKRITESKLAELDNLIDEQMKQISKMLSDRDALEASVKENKDKAEWIKNFVEQVDELLTI